MEQRLTIITLGVKNLQQSTQFYTEIFGWSKSQHSNEGIAFFELEGMQLALYSEEKLVEDAAISSNGNGFKGFTLAYCTRTEQEVDELFAKFEAAGVRIVKRPEKVFWGGYSGYIADPDENLWEIAFNPFLDKKYLPE